MLNERDIIIQYMVYEFKNNNHHFTIICILPGGSTQEYLVSVNPQFYHNIVNVTRYAVDAVITMATEYAWRVAAKTINSS